MIMKFCIEQYVLKLYKVNINDDPELTLTHFKTNVKFGETWFCSMAQITGERLQDHWSSGLSSLNPILICAGLKIDCF